MINDVLAKLTVQGGRDVAGDFALSVAATFNAHIAGAAVWYEPMLPSAALAEGGIAVADLLEAQRLDNQQAAQRATERFERRAKASFVAAETRMLHGLPADVADLFAQAARRFDLSVVPQQAPNSDEPDRRIAEAALFDSGRPLLLVPDHQTTGLKLDLVMVCWDGSRAAARAVGDAIPILQRANHVDVVTVVRDAGASGGPAELPGLSAADIGRHLAHYGITVATHGVPAGDKDVASTLLAYAGDRAADVMVMGGYGHSRLREFIVGGATRAVLAAPAVPTLMSH
jgi:nucleotide-binding universal stress UspA family protein